ncbi:MAG: aldo/keto reductase [Parahaliea sp.]
MLQAIDLYLLYWPAPGVFERTVANWRTLEHLLAEGRTRAIGVSNFSSGNLERLARRVTVVRPARIYENGDNFDPASAPKISLPYRRWIAACAAAPDPDQVDPDTFGLAIKN